jgi:hypothetical protein
MSYNNSYGWIWKGDNCFKSEYLKTSTPAKVMAKGSL